MTKQAGKIIKSIGKAFLIGNVLSLALSQIFWQPDQVGEVSSRAEVFRIDLVVIALVNLAYAICCLSALLTLFAKVRSRTTLRFLCFFLLPFSFFGLVLTKMEGFEEVLQWCVASFLFLGTFIVSSMKQRILVG